MNIRGNTCHQTVMCCREGVKPSSGSSERTPGHVSLHLMYDRSGEPMA